MSVASVVVGVANSGADLRSIWVAGGAALVAGAVSMAAGEYVSVKSQADTEAADLTREARELLEDPQGELAELAGIYEQRGLSRGLALEVANALTAHNALEAHARDELGITETLQARPLEAAGASAAAFLVGGLIPVASIVGVPRDHLSIGIALITLVALAILGALAGVTGGASAVRGAIRVTFWGALAMSLTAVLGAMLGGSAIP